MNNQLILSLKRKLEDIASYGEVDIETQRNVLKEELQYYVLNFIYHHPDYSKWIMYGGSSLRICHGLDRMSVDLDFEIANSCSEDFLKSLKSEIEKYFIDTYGLEAGMLTIKVTHGRGLLLRFIVGDALDIEHPSKQVHVKIDLNHFTTDKVVTEHIPVNHDQFSFVIKAYNMSALMASKIAAILLRGERGVGKAIYKEKGRDIYDLLWYMGKRIVPDLDYLKAKGLDISDLRKLFDQLTIKMNDVNIKNLRDDLTPLFPQKASIESWLENWLNSYLRLIEEYDIKTVTKLQEVVVHQDFSSDNVSFIYFYNTEEGRNISITYTISDYWLRFKEGDLSTKINDSIVKLIAIRPETTKAMYEERINKYATLFHKKTEAYLKKTNKVLIGDNITTKVIRMSADKLNQKEQIVLNKSALESCEFEDLLK